MLEEARDALGRGDCLMAHDLALQALDLDESAWRAALCERAGRNLTGAEWMKYFSVAGAYRETCPTR